MPTELGLLIAEMEDELRQREIIVKLMESVTGETLFPMSDINIRQFMIGGLKGCNLRNELILEHADLLINFRRMHKPIDGKNLVKYIKAIITKSKEREGYDALANAVKIAILTEEISGKYERDEGIASSRTYSFIKDYLVTHL